MPAERIVRIGDNKGGRYASDNFWMMGDTGPCGPCTEIFYDHGPEIVRRPAGLARTKTATATSRSGTTCSCSSTATKHGVMHKLPKPCVDTGMGLERLTAVLQHVHSNYEIDLFVELLAAAKQAVDARRHRRPRQGLAFAEGHRRPHPRLLASLVADGVIPGNDGRGYVLRRIVRRAIRHGYKLGARKPFFHTLVAALGRRWATPIPNCAATQRASPRC